MSDHLVQATRIQTKRMFRGGRLSERSFALKMVVDSKWRLVSYGFTLSQVNVGCMKMLGSQ